MLYLNTPTINFFFLYPWVVFLDPRLQKWLNQSKKQVNRIELVMWSFDNI